MASPGFSISELISAIGKAKDIYSAFRDEYDSAPARIKELIDTSKYLHDVLLDCQSLLDQYGDVYRPETANFVRKLDEVDAFIKKYEALKQEHMNAPSAPKLIDRVRKASRQAWQTTQYALDDQKARDLKDGLQLEIQKLVFFILVFALRRTVPVTPSNQMSRSTINERLTVRSPTAIGARRGYMAIEHPGEDAANEDNFEELFRKLQLVRYSHDREMSLAVQQNREASLENVHQTLDSVWQSLCLRAGLAQRDGQTYPLPDTQLLEAPARNFNDVIVNMASISIHTPIHFDSRIEPLTPLPQRMDSRISSSSATTSDPQLAHSDVSSAFSPDSTAWTTPSSPFVQLGDVRAPSINIGNPAVPLPLRVVPKVSSSSVTTSDPQLSRSQVFSSFSPDSTARTTLSSPRVQLREARAPSIDFGDPALPLPQRMVSRVSSSSAATCDPHLSPSDVLPCSPNSTARTTPSSPRMQFQEPRAPSINIGNPALPTHVATIDLPVPGTSKFQKMFLHRWELQSCGKVNRLVWAGEVNGDYLEHYLPTNVYPRTLHKSHEEELMHVNFHQDYRLLRRTKEVVNFDQPYPADYVFTTADLRKAFQGDLRRKLLVESFDIDVIWSEPHSKKHNGEATFQDLKMWQDVPRSQHSLSFYASSTLRRDLEFPILWFQSLLVERAKEKTVEINFKSRNDSLSEFGLQRGRTSLFRKKSTSSAKSVSVGGGKAGFGKLQRRPSDGTSLKTAPTFSSSADESMADGEVATYLKKLCIQFSSKKDFESFGTFFKDAQRGDRPAGQDPTSPGSDPGSYFELEGSSPQLSELPASSSPSELPGSYPPLELPASFPPSELSASYPPSELPASNPPWELPASYPPSELPASDPTWELPASYPPSELPASLRAGQSSSPRSIAMSPASFTVSRSRTVAPDRPWGSARGDFSQR